MTRSTRRIWNFPTTFSGSWTGWSSYIPETKETVQARQRPIVIITSNAEKELPDAFLRRCVFHYIEFPEQAQMEAILRVHFGDLEEKLVKQSLAAFYWLRELRGIEKSPPPLSWWTGSGRWWPAAWTRPALKRRSPSPVSC